MKQIRSMIPLLLSYGLVTTFLSLYGVFVTYWLEDGFHETSYFKITLIAGIPPLITMMGINLWAIIADRYQKRRVLISMAAIAAAIQYLLLARYVTNIVSFLLVVSFFPIFYSAIQVVTPALATLIIPEKGKASGIFVMAGSMGWFSGGILGGVLYPRMGMRWILTLAFILCTAAGIIILFSEDPKDPETDQSAKQEALSWIQVLRTPQITIVVITLLLLITGNSIFFGLSTNYLINIVGLNTFQVGLGVSIASLIGAILSRPLGNYMDHHGRRRVFLFGIIIYPLAIPIFYFIRNPWIATIIWCFPFYLWTWTSGIAILADISQSIDRSKAVGLFFASTSLGQAVGSVIGGLISDIFGLRFLTILPLPIGIVAFVIAFIFLKESLPEQDTQQIEMDYA